MQFKQQIMLFSAVYKYTIYFMQCGKQTMVLFFFWPPFAEHPNLPKKPQ